MNNIVQKVFYMITASFIFVLCGCSNNIEKSELDSRKNFVESKLDIKNELDDSENFTNLETAGKFDNIRFDDTYVGVCVFSDENYWFSNRNKSFYNKFIAFLKNVKFYSQQVEVEKVDSKNFYISVFDETNYVSFYIYENDIIEIVDDADRCYYYCDNVYKKFIETFETFFNENQKYCRSAVTPIREWYEYAVYDRNHNVLESDYSIKTPYLYYNSGIVHLCGQAGTGPLARWARFFDVENGLISPNYYGQTDFFGDMVSATDSSRVVVYEMFSGKQICVFNQFEKPLCDCTENIQSAYFSEDGTQLVVKYMNSKYEIETQAFNI